MYRVTSPDFKCGRSKKSYWDYFYGIQTSALKTLSKKKNVGTDEDTVAA
jgi:hypothetical protein